VKKGVNIGKKIEKIEKNRNVYQNEIDRNVYPKII